MKKRLVSLLLVLMTVLAMTVPVSAVGAGGSMQAGTADGSGYGTVRDMWADPWQTRMDLGGRYDSEKVQEIAQDIMCRSGAVTDYDRLRTTCIWVAANVDYHVATAYRHMGKECPEEYAGMYYTYDVDGILDGAQTICGGYVCTAMALLDCMDIPSVAVTGYVNGTYHAWFEAFADGRWVICDPTAMAPFSRVLGTGEYAQIYVDMSYFDVGPERFESRYQDYRRTVNPYWTVGGFPIGWTRMSGVDGYRDGIIPYDLSADYYRPISREGFCRLMVRLAEPGWSDRTAPIAASPFKDTRSREVAEAYRLGIVSGTGPDTFTPDGTVTRQEAAVMLARTARSMGLQEGVAVVPDDLSDADAWAADDILFVCGLADAGGTPVMGCGADGAFRPKDELTKEQAFAAVMRLFGMAAEE